MKIERIPVDAVEIGDGHREVDGAVVAALAASMNMIGQLQPITVYESGGTAHLVAGRHRLEAARSLGWDDIDGVFVTGDDIDHRLREISENLHRAELTVQERSDQIAEWADLIQQKAVMRQVGASRGMHPAEKGQRKTARELNITEQAVRRAREIASIAPEAKEEAKRVGIDDNQSKLLKVAAAAPEKQVAVVHELAGRRTGAVDRDVRDRAAHAVAELIAQYVPGAAWDGLKANLYAAGAAGIANALTNITGEAIMDKNFA